MSDHGVSSDDEEVASTTTSTSTSRATAAGGEDDAPPKPSRPTPEGGNLSSKHKKKRKSGKRKSGKRKGSRSHRPLRDKRDARRARKASRAEAKAKAEAEAAAAEGDRGALDTVGGAIAGVGDMAHGAVDAAGEAVESLGEETKRLMGFEDIDDNEDDIKRYRICGHDFQSSTLVVIAITLLVAAFFIWSVITGDFTEWLEAILEWIDSIGYWGYVMIIVIMIVIAFPFIAGYSAVALGAGFLFPIIPAFLSVWIGTAIGSMLVFTLGRLYLKNYFKRVLRKNKYYSAVLHAVKQEPYKLLILMRLSPLPVGFVNILLSVTPIPAQKYVIGTLCGMTPEQIFFVIVGNSLGNLAEAFSSGFTPETTILLFIQLIAGCIVAAALYHYSKKAMAMLDAATEEARALEQGREGTEMTSVAAAGGDDGDGSGESAASNDNLV